MKDNEIKLRAMIMEKLSEEIGDNKWFKMLLILDGNQAVSAKKKDRSSPYDTDAIADGAMRFFEKRENKEAFAADLVSPLRSFGIALPDADRVAANSIAATMSRRPDRFMKVPGKSAKQTATWKLISHADKLRLSDG